jgi:hypothetical protein
MLNKRSCLAVQRCNKKADSLGSPPFCCFEAFARGSNFPVVMFLFKRGPTNCVSPFQIESVGLFVYMFLILILIALFPLSAAKQNEINPKNEEKLFER